ncbi:hypothetical protein GWK47_040722 [Chionoecetes opilio]|uniref:Uncharacterized protein n=1 Tax=Chionoecetes opilio TaxID=41210 RepID=A0A8J4YAH1_CHIOP|nr:hypothetical protein GWK47_040722 [Chionoecetes opilio]
MIQNHVQACIQNAEGCVLLGGSKDKLGRASGYVCMIHFLSSLKVFPGPFLWKLLMFFSVPSRWCCPLNGFFSSHGRKPFLQASSAFTQLVQSHALLSSGPPSPLTLILLHDPDSTTKSLRRILKPFPMVGRRLQIVWKTPPPMKFLELPFFREPGSFGKSACKHANIFLNCKDA